MGFVRELNGIPQSDNSEVIIGFVSQEQIEEEIRKKSLTLIPRANDNFIYPAMRWAIGYEGGGKTFVMRLTFQNHLTARAEHWKANAARLSTVLNRMILDVNDKTRLRLLGFNSSGLTQRYFDDVLKFLVRVFDRKDLVAICDNSLEGSEDMFFIDPYEFSPLKEKLAEEKDLTGKNRIIGAYLDVGSKILQAISSVCKHPFKEFVLSPNPNTTQNELCLKFKRSSNIF